MKLKSIFFLLLLCIVACGQPNEAVVTAVNPTVTLAPTSTPTVASPTETAVSTNTAEAVQLTPTPLPTPVPAPTTNPATPISVIELERFEAFESQFLGNSRVVRIFLPPNYRHELNMRHYPVLYLNDGQVAGRWQLRQTLLNLYRAEQIEPIIAVAIFNNDFRNFEYGTAGIPSANGEGTRADLYTRFVIEELKPVIDAQYRTLPEPEHTAVLGSSLGGLSAFDMAWRHPETFGIAGAMSGSFWWYDAGQNEIERVANRVVHRYVSEMGKQDGLRVWLSAGTAEQRSYRDGVGEITAVRDTGDLANLLMQLGYQKPNEISYTVIPNGEHNGETWRTVLPDFLLWAFPRD